MKIVEIFESLQGEGKNQGRPCFFIRLAGCNLSCHWCDTVYAKSGGTEIGCEEILEQCWRKNPHLVCITGGEPLLQKDALLSILPSLHKRGTEIDIETNGTMAFTDLQPYASVCMDVKCPSSREASDLSLLSAIRPTDSVKFVIMDEEDCRYAKDVLDHHPIAGEIFFSPVYGTNYQPIIRYILENDLQVRFQLQLHKIIGVK
jgi:7-carboxy-7-deazaguanine synthase